MIGLSWSITADVSIGEVANVRHYSGEEGDRVPRKSGSVLLSWIQDNNGQEVAFGEPLNKSLPGVKCNVIDGLTMT
jgi:hypothetical protein